MLRLIVAVQRLGEMLRGFRRHRRFAGIGHRHGARRRRQRAVHDHDLGVAHAFPAHQREQDRSIVRPQPHAAMRGGMAEVVSLHGAVHRVAAMKEHRPRHRRHAVLVRIPVPLDALGAEMAGGRHVAAPSGGDRPAIGFRAVDHHRQALLRFADIDQKFGPGRRRQTKQRAQGDDADTTHDLTPNSLAQTPASPTRRTLVKGWLTIKALGGYSNFRDRRGWEPSRHI